MRLYGHRRPTLHQRGLLPDPRPGSTPLQAPPSSALPGLQPDPAGQPMQRGGMRAPDQAKPPAQPSVVIDLTSEDDGEQGAGQAHGRQEAGKSRSGSTGVAIDRSSAGRYAKSDIPPALQTAMSMQCMGVWATHHLWF